MPFQRLTIAAIVFTAMYLPTASADETPASTAAKCEALFMKDKFSEAQPYCEKAAEEFGKEGVLLFGRYFERQGKDWPPS